MSRLLLSRLAIVNGALLNGFGRHVAMAAG